MQLFATNLSLGAGMSIRAERADDREISRSRRVLDRFLFDLVVHLRHVLAGSRSGVAGTQQRRGAEEREQDESQ